MAMVSAADFEVAGLFFISRAVVLSFTAASIAARKEVGFSEAEGPTGIDEDRRSIFNSEFLASFPVGLNFGFHLLAAGVLFEPLQVQANRPGVGIKQRLDILGFGPDRLLAISKSCISQKRPWRPAASAA